VKTVFDVLIGTFETQISQAQESLGGGAAKDYAEYREVCGRIRGLRLAIYEVQTLAKNVETEDD
jgi:hypothetical protein